MMKGKAQRRVGSTGWSSEAQKRKDSLPRLLQPLQVILRCFHFFLRSLPKLPCLAGAPQYWALILYKTPWKEMTLSETPLCTHVLSHFSRVWLFATLWTTAHQALLSMGFSRQEYWSGLPCPPPWDLSDPGIEPSSPAFPAMQVDSLPLSHQGSPWNTFTGNKRSSSRSVGKNTWEAEQ